MYNLCHRRWKCHGFYIALLGYGSMIEEANNKLMSPVGKQHSMLYDWKDVNKICVVWQNIRRGLNEIS